MSVDVVKLTQRVDAHVERLRGGDNNHDNAIADDDDHGSADDHHHNRRRVRAALDDDDIDHDHEQHDDDHSRPELPVYVPDVLRLGGWVVYPHDVRGWRTNSVDPVHDDDEQHDHDNPVVRLRDDDHEHDDGPAGMHGRLYVGRRAERPGLESVAVGQEDRPLRPDMSMPAAEFGPLLQLRLDLVRDHHDDHDAGALVLRFVHVLVGSRTREVGFPRIFVQPGLSGLPVHAAIDHGRPVPSDHGSLCGARDADDDHHDHGRPVLAVLHHDDDERYDDDGPAVRVGVLRVGLGAFAGRMVADRLLVPVAVPVRDAERERDGRVSAGADALHGDDDHDHEYDDDD